MAAEKEKKKEKEKESAAAPPKERKAFAPMVAETREIQKIYNWHVTKECFSSGLTNVEVHGTRTPRRPEYISSMSVVDVFDEKTGYTVLHDDHVIVVIGPPDERMKPYIQDDIQWNDTAESRKGFADLLNASSLPWGVSLLGILGENEAARVDVFRKNCALVKHGIALGVPAHVKTSQIKFWSDLVHHKYISMARKLRTLLTFHECQFLVEVERNQSSHWKKIRGEYFYTHTPLSDKLDFADVPQDKREFFKVDSFDMNPPAPKPTAATAAAALAPSSCTIC